MGINIEDIKPQNKKIIDLNNPLNNNNDLNLSIIKSVNSLNNEQKSDIQISNKNIIEKNDNNEEASNNKRKHKSLSQNGDLIKSNDNDNELLSNFSRDNYNKLYSNQKSTQFSVNNTNNNNNNNNYKEINELLQYKKKIKNNFSSFKEMKNGSYRSLQFNSENKYNHPKTENNDICSKETIKVLLTKNNMRILIEQ